MTLMGRCCHCVDPTPGEVPMYLDIDGKYHDTSVSSYASGPVDQWFIRAENSGEFLRADTYWQYAMQWRGGSSGGWTDWLNLTNIVDVTRIPNPVSSGFGSFNAGSLGRMPSQGFLPKSHFMRPARITGFSGHAVYPHPQYHTDAPDGVEWRVILNGAVISNNPERLETPWGPLHLPFFEPQPEDTSYSSEGQEFQLQMRIKRKPNTTDVQFYVYGTFPPVGSTVWSTPHIRIKYEFNNNFIGTEPPSAEQIADETRDGLGHYTGWPDSDMRVQFWEGLPSNNDVFNCFTNFYNGSLMWGYDRLPTGEGNYINHGVNSTLRVTGFKPDGASACPFGAPVYYTKFGVFVGTHPAWGYPQNGTTTFHRHFHDVKLIGRGPIRSEQLVPHRKQFEPMARTIELTPGFAESENF